MARATSSIDAEPGGRTRGGALRGLRLRRRLTIAFVLVAGLSAVAVAVSSFLFVRQARLEDSLRQAEPDVRYQLVLAQQFLPLNDARQQSLLDSFARTGRTVVLISDGVATPSDPAVDPPVPAELRDRVSAGEIGYHRISGGGEPLLLVGGRIPGSTEQLYVVYSEERIYRDLSQLRTVLLVGAGTVTLVAAVVGYALARRTLEPVGRAAAAAQAIASGELQTRLPVAADEFGSWALSFNRMAEALEARIAELSAARERERRFTADVAHELRTPVTALVTEASLLEEQLADLPADARRPAELLVGDVVRLRRLVEELMEVSRLDSGRQAFRVTDVDLARLIGSIIAARGWEDRVRFDAPETTVRTDPHRLERVLANLIANAVEHGGPDVEVGLAGTEERVRVEIVDHGPGIEPEDLPHLFDRFYKADPARSSGGSGLGLAIAQENARLLGVEITVHSVPGLGTRFRVALPVAEPLPAGDADAEYEDQDRPPEQGGAS